jgi:hypothetical protein
MEPSVWYINPGDPCLNDPGTPGFHDEHWTVPHVSVVVAEHRSLEYHSPDMVDTMIALMKRVAVSEFGLSSFEIYENGEIPFLCRHGTAAYRFCVQTEKHPQRTWCHVFMNDQNEILGFRLEND